LSLTKRGWWAEHKRDWVLWTMVDLVGEREGTAMAPLIVTLDIRDVPESLIFTIYKLTSLSVFYAIDFEDI